MAFKLKSGNTTPFKQMGGSPAKQKYDYTITDSRSDEDIQKEKDEIRKAKDKKKKDQERINQQIEGTYVETEEDKERMMERTKDYRPKKDKSSQPLKPNKLKEAVGGFTEKGSPTKILAGLGAAVSGIKKSKAYGRMG